MKFNMIAAAMVGLSVASNAAMAATEADVQNSFFPYASYKPAFEGLQVGTVINAGNVVQIKGLLDPAMYDYVKKGWYEFPVGETTSFDLHPNYVQVTKDNLGKTQLGAEVGAISGR